MTTPEQRRVYAEVAGAMALVADIWEKDGSDPCRVRITREYQAAYTRYAGGEGAPTGQQLRDRIAELESQLASLTQDRDEWKQAAIAANQRLFPRPQPVGRPHSRACNLMVHPHGTACHASCPTCGGHEDWMLRAEEVDLNLDRGAVSPIDHDLPGTWTHADFEGGDPDERSYAERERKDGDG